ncbi:TerC family protein [Lewinella sp. LCG006]|uniref:TerC family protein n=1 Tax=Lewinella sp. LCG006 TaxID=3231911 RepID=UPI00346087BC
MLLWSIFIVFILFLLGLDLGVFNRDNHVPSTREALRWTSLWAALGVSFAVVVYYLYQNHLGTRELTGGDAVLKYLSGYLVELSLSMDNVFVMALIFKYFKIPQQFQHRVLFWGILGALVFRGIMIGAGVWLLEHFQWMMYIFGAILIYSAYKMLTSDEEVDPNRNPIIKYAKKLFPVSKQINDESFFVRRKHILAATPLFIALLMVETTDILFAFDSIPAILAITTDPFLVFSSNVFAILGLRSLYFVLASMMDRFEYMKYSLAIILFFVAAKMMLHEIWHPAEWLSLVVIFVLLAGGVFVSLYQTRKEEKVG